MAQEYPLVASDETELDSWFFAARRRDPKNAIAYPPERPLGTVIQFHGNAENMSSHYISLAWLVDYGFNLFTFDYRGYGKSQGSPDQRGTYLDALAALDRAWELHQASGARPNFIVYGQSLGGAIAMRAVADFKHRSEVNWIVMDSTFSSYRQIAREKMSSFWLTWPLQWLSGVLVSDEYSAEESLHRNCIPLLVVHDLQDPAVPFDLGQKIYDEDGEDAKNCPKTFWTLDTGYHIGVFTNPVYRVRFVRQVTQRQ